MVDVFRLGTDTAARKLSRKVRAPRDLLSASKTALENATPRNRRAFARRTSRLPAAGSARPDSFAPRGAPPTSTRVSFVHFCTAVGLQTPRLRPFLRRWRRVRRALVRFASDRRFVRPTRSQPQSQPNSQRASQPMRVGVCFVRVDLREREGKAKEGPRGKGSMATMAQRMRTRCAPKSAWKRSNRNDVRVKASATPAGGSKTRVKDTVELGASGVHVSAVGAGAWSWGDRSGYWGYGKEYGKDASKDAYQALMEGGVNFIDTAEVYGFGMSEEFLGEFMKETKGKFDQDPAVATKFAPLPWRFTEDSVVDALKDSLKRLGRDKVELYMQHWPGFFLNAFSNDAYLNGLARCKEMGLADAIGVSNFNKNRLREAYEKLGAKGVVLASNQVQYSLIYREPESNGVMETCKELGITLVAYSPLAQGLLTGKYSLSNKPTGPRKGFFTDEKLRQVEPLVGLMKEIGQGHGDKTPAQVAINWTICKGALPIPGVKTVRQAEEVIGSIGWRLTEDEMSSLEKSARGITSLGAPFENW